jgi:hypothetical protein
MDGPTKPITFKMAAVKGNIANEEIFAVDAESEPGHPVGKNRRLKVSLGLQFGR